MPTLSPVAGTKRRSAAAAFRVTVPVATSWSYPVPGVVVFRSAVYVAVPVSVGLLTVKTPVVPTVPGDTVPCRICSWSRCW